MEHLLPGLEPPKRSKEEKAASLQKIKQRTAKKKWNWQYYATICAAVAVFFVLVASLKSVPLNENFNTSTSADIDAIYAFEQSELYSDYRTHMSKWYNLDKKRLSDSEIESFKSLMARLEPITQPIDLDRTINHTGFITKYSDGTEHFYLLNYSQSELLNLTAKQKVLLETDEVWFLMDMGSIMDDRLPFLTKIFMVFGLIAIYFTLLHKVSPIRKIMAEEHDVKKRSIFLKGFGTLVAVIIVISITLYNYEAINILFILSFYTLYFLLNKCWKWFRGKSGYSYLEIPISAIFFTLLSILYII